MKSNPTSPGKTRADLLRAVARRQLGLPASEVGIERLSRSIAPLSYAQSRIWFIHQLEPDSALYNIPIALVMRGELNVRALEQSLQEIVCRHESLRTTFSVVDSEPVQVIHNCPTLNLDVHDFSVLVERARDKEQKSQIEQEARHHFDLSEGPLFRACLLRLSSTEHILLLTLHHIVSDGWSQGVLRRDLSELYNAFSAGKPSPLHEIPIQYADYAVWQRSQLQGEALDRQLTYWKHELSGAPGLLELPYDRPRPAVQSYRGARTRFQIASDLTQSIKSLGQQVGATPFMTLLAAFNVLLWRYSGQADIIVGTAIANRTHAQTESVIGCFFNSLAIRAHVSGNAGFRELLIQIRETTLAAYAHQDLPFDRIVEELHPERSLSYSPVFQVALIFQNAHREALNMDGLQVQSLTGEGIYAKYDLLLVITESNGSFSGSLEYSTELFDASTIDRMLTHYETLLAGIVADADQSVSSLPLLTAPEHKQLLVDWNCANSVCSPGRIHILFEEHADRAPASVAVVFQDKSICYSQLNARANQLARYLRLQGVGPGIMVGIYLERSLEMLVGMLGILKAGGAYLPLDSGYPHERLIFMLADSGTSLVLTSEHLRERLAATQSRLLVIDESSPEIASQISTNLGVVSDVADPAYVIYTSGSTGQPKGVVICHQQVVQLVTDLHPQLGVDGSDIWTVFHSYGFDFSVWEIWSSLLTGARLVVVAEEVTQSPDQLYELLVREGVTILNLTPSALMSFASYVQAYRPDRAGLSLRSIHSGGEALSGETAREVLSWGISFWNLYGPTESTVWASVKCVDVTAEPRPLVSIGRPFTGRQVYILDNRLQPCPPGVYGELFIGGNGVARGYVNRPELTAEKFGPDPFGNQSGSCLYRTGDRCRRLADGNLEFSGRLDHQVKVRGFRIELGEIESVLIKHPSVREAVAVVREDQPGDSRLVAYVVSRDGELNVGDLRNHLRDRLPEYMLPSVFVNLDSMRLTANGKVDRKSLPAPASAATEERYTAPRTPIEEGLADIWREVLNVDQVDIHDSFFDLGGHSLLATQVIARIRRTFNVDLALRELFNAPNVAAIAKLIVTARGQGGRTVPLLSRVSRTHQMPLSFAQQRLWFLDQFEPGGALYNIPMALSLKGTVNIAALQQSLHEILRRHEALRTRFILKDGLAFQETGEIGSCLDFVDLTSLSSPNVEIEAQRRINVEARRPFDLENGPLFRASLLTLDNESHVLLLTMHHIASDGWSLGVLRRELRVLYAAYCGGDASPLPDLPIQYCDYAAWQRNWLDGEALEVRLLYWKNHLIGAPALLDLPYDRPRPGIQSFRGARRRLTVSSDLTQRIKALSQREGTTLFMTLFAALNVLLNRYSGQEDIVVGTPIANRTHSEVEGLIGFFANTLPLRTDLSGNPTFRGLLSRVREVALGAYAHQDLPFEKIVEELHPERSLSHSPIFQSVFILQNAPREVLDMSGVQVQPMGAESESAKYDLLWSLSESGEGLSGYLEYSSDLFDSSTIDRMITHFNVLLYGVVTDCDIQIRHIPLLSASERQKLLFEWNDTRADYPRDRCVHEFFEEQAYQTPGAVAVVFEDESLTYAQLNARANQLAQHLVAFGVGPDVLVGLCMERSLEMVAGLLGILKAGGAYVPLDPSYPPERLAFMLADASPTLVLSRKTHADMLSTWDVPVVYLDSEWLFTHGEDEGNVTVNTSADCAAYVIYTSGTTGRPKGVVIRRGSLTNYLSWCSAAYRAADGAGSPVHSSLSFDLTVTSLMPALMAGRTVLLTPESDGVESLTNALRSGQDLSLVKITPAHLQLLSNDLTPYQASGCTRAFIVGGEALLPEQAEFWSRNAPQTRIINEYGPTETVVGCCVFECGPDLSVYASTGVPIGRPIANTQLYILDTCMEPVPIGVHGELFIGGDGLARGYLNHPELTAERFVPDPFSVDNGARLYRTGDQCRYLPDGNLEFLGRLDHQVKIRGFRIELGEIESILMGYSGVKEAVVMAREDEVGDKRLVAYLALDTGSALQSNVIREYVGEKLPAYMIPSSYVILDSMPLSHNGKLDRKALPAPDSPISGDSYVAPRTPIENGLVEIWCEVLGVSQVGVNDNFFESGGHSLLAVRLISEIRRVFGQKLPFQMLFQSATIAAIARELSPEYKTTCWANAHTVTAPVRGSKRVPMFCVAAEQVNALGYVALGRHLGAGQPLYVLQTYYRSNRDRPYSAEELQDLGSVHIRAMRDLQPVGPYCLGGMCEGAHIAFEMARQLQLEGIEVSLLASFDAWPEQNTRSRFGWWRSAVSKVFAHRKRDASQSLFWVTKQVGKLTARSIRHLFLLVLKSEDRNTWEARYWPGRSFVPPKFDGRITVLRVADQPLFRPKRMDLGWTEWATRGVEVYDVTGEHGSLLREPHVQLVANILGEHLTRAQEKVLQSSMHAVVSAASAQTERVGSQQLVGQ